AHGRSKSILSRYFWAIFAAVQENASTHGRLFCRQCRPRPAQPGRGIENLFNVSARAGDKRLGMGCQAKSAANSP
ncbi:MAG: hypothetical protein Q4D74_09855, partial [Comamonadaceae bacterium]|nr:hypothetical protein [Comamonadaceae bacterium]